MFGVFLSICAHVRPLYLDQLCMDLTMSRIEEKKKLCTNELKKKRTQTINNNNNIKVKRQQQNGRRIKIKWRMEEKKKWRRRKENAEKKLALTIPQYIKVLCAFFFSVSRWNKSVSVDVANNENQNIVRRMGNDCEVKKNHQNRRKMSYSFICAIF